MKKKNGVKIIQTAGYNGARTVYVFFDGENRKTYFLIIAIIETVRTPGMPSIRNFLQAILDTHVFRVINSSKNLGSASE